MDLILIIPKHRGEIWSILYNCIMANYSKIEMKFKNRIELENYIVDRTQALEEELLNDLPEKFEYNMEEIYRHIGLEIERETRKILESYILEEP